MRKLIYASVAIAGLFLATSGTAEAGRLRFSFGGGHHHHGYHGGHGFYGGHYGHGHYGGVYSYPTYPRYHDTSHYDWHPGGYLRHGNHYDYVPGHYDWHPTGHWHY